MKPHIFLFLISISALSAVRSYELPFIISVSDHEILPVPTECPKFENPNENVHIAHESDCGAFYQCSHGDRKIKYCKGSLHFNPRLQTCDYPWSAGCIIISTPTTPSTEAPGTPSSTTAEATYPTPTSTPTPTTPTTEAPATPSSTPTEGTSPTPTTPTTESPVTSSSTTTEATSPTPTPTTPTTETPTTSSITPEPSYPISCPKVDPTVPINLPHECACSKYYACRNRLQILQECSEGLHFNPRLHICDSPETAGCINTTPAPIPNPGTTPPTTDPNSTAVVPTECPNTNDGDVVHLAHETDCSLFYKCDYGRKVLLACPSGLLFNRVLQVCDWPVNVKCSSSPSWTR